MNNLNDITLFAVDELKRLGANMATASAAMSKVHEFNVDGGEFSLFRTLFNNSVSLSAVKEGKRGVSAVNKLSPEDVKAACLECIATAESATPDDAWALAPDCTHETFFEEDNSPNLDLLFDRSVELVKYIEENHPRVIIEQMIVTHAECERVYRNTNGAFYEESYGSYGVDLMFSAHEGDETSSFYSTGITTKTLDKPFHEMGSIKKDLSDVEKQIYTKPVKGKFEGTVVLTPDALATFMSSVISNFTGSRSILEKTSIWLDKRGEKVADERLTVKFPLSLEGVVGRETFTGEGFLCEEFTLIENGVLKEFPLSLYVANKTGNTPAKSSLSCMYIVPGEKSLEEIISNIERGILVGRFSGGEPGISGEFSGVAKNSFIIENGKVGEAVSETMISGNLATMLNCLVDISKDTVCDGSSVTPYAAFNGITISGK